MRTLRQEVPRLRSANQPSQHSFGLEAARMHRLCTSIHDTRRTYSTHALQAHIRKGAQMHRMRLLIGRVEQIEAAHASAHRREAVFVRLL